MDGNVLLGLAFLGLLLLPPLIGLFGLPPTDPPTPPRPKQIITLPDGSRAPIYDAAELAAYEQALREYNS
jgi:hypothetical protein